MRRVLAVVALLVAGCSAPAVSTSTTAGPRSAPTARPTEPGTRAGMPTCALDSLPRQAHETAADVVRGGPFDHPRNDGVTYFNRNKALPKRATGTYREFTVRTPGASTRGVRRLVTDGNPTKGAPTRTPSAWYYTGDHYTTFCQVTGTP